MRNIRIYIWAFFSLLAFSSFAQETDRDFIRLGNKFYNEGLMDEAATSYNKALDKKKSFEAHYNLANVYALSGQDSTAFEEYKKALDQPCTNVKKKAKAFHNMGNLMYSAGCLQMKGQDSKATESFKNAVDLYKSSLRNNPADDETRYNLAMAQYMLKKSQSEGGSQGEDDKDEKKDNKEKQNEQQQQEQKQEQKQQQQERKDSMSDEVVEQLLNSAQQDENNIQRKIQNQQGQGQRRQLEKDW